MGFLLGKTKHDDNNPVNSLRNRAAQSLKMTVKTKPVKAPKSEKQKKTGSMASRLGKRMSDSYAKQTTKVPAECFYSFQ